MERQRPMPEEIQAGFYPGFERNWHRVELIGRSLMLVAVGATLAGLLGGGPVSLWTRKVVSGNLEVEYAPVIRFGTPTGLRIQVQVPAGQDRATVILPGDIVDRYGLQSIYPVPTEAQGAPDGSMRLVFPVQPGAQAGNRTVVVQVGGLPSGGGALHLSARTEGGVGGGAAWSQLVLP